MDNVCNVWSSSDRNAGVLTETISHQIMGIWVIYEPSQASEFNTHKRHHALETEKYYENVWKDTIQEAWDWVRPSENSEFKSALHETCIDSYDTYDFIIIGGGTAGAVVANRLSEIEDFSVLLVEAGGEETDASLIPAAFNLISNSRMNWGYVTTPQKHACYGVINRQCDFTTAKVLGGGSAINAMMHVRGNKLDFRSWDMSYTQKWSYENVLPYFIKSENTATLDLNRDYHGVKGPLKVTQPVPKSLIHDFIKANVELGLKELDYNGEEQIGISQLQVNVYKGKRSSTNQAYLKPIKNIRKNLKIIDHALVTKINFDENNRVDSVKLIHNNACFYFKAKKEVIVSAGAVNTPQLLMLSGIGPKAHLETLNIKTIADLPVGKNLIDHNTVFNIPILTNKTITKQTLRKKFKDYAKGQGMFSYPPARGVGYVKVSEPFNEGMPDVEVIYNFPNSDIPIEVFNKVNLFNNYMKKTQVDLSTGFQLVFVQLHPFSRGEITLASNSPIDFPIIDPKYLEDPRDIDIVYKAIKRTLKLLQTKTFKEIDAKLGSQSIPECDGIQYDRLYWYCIIKYKTGGIFHPVGTCRMGTNSESSVVDENLRIHNFPNTRIVDASVFPAMISGHINSVVVAIAEKISDEIKQTYGIF